MKNKDGLILGIIGGVAFGFTAGVGFILAQKTMAKVGTRGGAEHSEMLGSVSRTSVSGLSSDAAKKKECINAGGAWKWTTDGVGNTSWGCHKR